MRDGWAETTLGEISEFVSARVMPELLSSAVPYVGLEHIDSRSPLIYRTGNVESVTSSVTPFESEDVLFGRLRPYLHKVAFAQFDGVCTPEVLVLRSKEVCSPKFLHFLCSMDSTISRCVEMSAGTRMPRTGAADLASVTVLLPPLEEQRRIVDVVASVDAYIDALKDKVEKARAARNAVLHELLSAGGPDWTETTLGDVADVLSGFAFKSEFFSQSDGIPLIRIRDLQNRTTTEVGYLGDFDDRFLVNRGDFLIGMDGEFRCYEWLGGPALLNQRVCRIQDFKTKIVVPRFVYFLVNDHLAAIEDSTSFTTVKHISAKQVKAISFLLPPMGEQKRIVEIISSMDDVIAASEKAVAEAVRLRSGLLSDLLSGEHEIPASYDSLVGVA